jgi:hypothetical protein
MDGIIFTQAGTGCIIENNIVVDNTGHGIEFWEVPELGAIRYNDCWHNHPDYGGCTPSVGEISANPSFVDTLNINYSLHFSSPCIDAGNPDGPLDPDLTRNDMGAFPFGGFAVMPLPYRINLGGAIPNISYSLTPIIFWDISIRPQPLNNCIKFRSGPIMTGVVLKCGIADLFLLRIPAPYIRVLP